MPKNKPTIGIIGGAGPDATIDLQKQISMQMKQTYHAILDQDHYRVITDNFTSMPDRSLAIHNNGKNPIPYMQKSAINLAQLGCNVICYPCNTAHIFLQEIQKAVDIPIIDMIQITTNYITQNTHTSIKKIGVICTNSTIKSGLYNNPNIETVYPDPHIQAQIMQAIFSIKAGYTTTKITNINYQNKIMHYLHSESDLQYLRSTFSLPPKLMIQNAIENLHKKNVDAIILGCTELPLCFTKNYLDSNRIIINPTSLLARAALKYCHSLENTNDITLKEKIT